MNARKGNAHRLRTVTLNIRSIGVNTVNWVGGGGVYPLKKIVDCLFYTPDHSRDVHTSLDHSISI